MGTEMCYNILINTTPIQRKVHHVVQTCCIILHNPVTDCIICSMKAAASQHTCDVALWLPKCS